jgi:lauroyl/myristoyl acyltransferase
MVSLARLSGAPILPIFCIQNGKGNTCLVIEPPIKTEGTEDRDQGLKNSVAQYAGLLESYIRKYPEKYRSWHHLESGGKN